MDNIDLLITCGFVKPMMQYDLGDVPTIVQTIALHLVILNSKAELVCEGMCALGVLDETKKAPNIFYPFFTSTGAATLAAGIISNRQYLITWII